MASSGGSWVKSTYTGGYAFIPQTVTKQVQVFTGDVVTGESIGGLAVVKNKNGTYDVIHVGSALSAVSDLKTKEAAMGAMVELHTTGVKWSGTKDEIMKSGDAQLTNVKTIAKAWQAKTVKAAKNSEYLDAKKLQASQKAQAQTQAKTPAKATETQAKAPPAKATPEQQEAAQKAATQTPTGAIKAAETVTASPATKSFDTWENAPKSQIAIKTKMGMDQTHEGVDMGKGVSITKNSKTGEFHVNSPETGKTVSTHKTFTEAQDSANKTVKAAAEMEAKNKAFIDEYNKMPTTKLQNAMTHTEVEGKATPYEGVVVVQKGSKFVAVNTVTGAETSSFNNPSDAVKNASDISLAPGSNWKSPTPSYFQKFNDDDYSPTTLVNGYKNFKLTKEESNAVSGYQDGNYSSINEKLWSAKGATTGQAHYSISAIESAMSKSPGAPHSMVVYRGKNKGSHLYTQMQGLNVGDKYQAHGFDSTSTSFQMAKGWGGGGVVVKYRVPQGFKGLPLNCIPGYSSSHSSEKEWIMPKGASWKVVNKAVSKNGEIYVEVEASF